jgi:plasmid stabilization system protein ParE
MRLEWSAAAGADLERFAAFLHDRFPGYATVMAEALVEKSLILLEHPNLGRPLKHHPDFRELVVHALRAAYVIQYRVAADRIVILRVFHGRETRD